MATINIYCSDIDGRYYHNSCDAIAAARDYWMQLAYSDRRNYCENADRDEHKYIDRMTLDVSDELAEQISKCSDDELNELLRNSEKLREIISELDYDDVDGVYNLERDIIADADETITAAADKLDNAYRVYRDVPIWIDARTVRELRVDIKTTRGKIESLYLSARVDNPGALRIEDVEDDYSVDGYLADQIIELLQLGWRAVVDWMDDEIREDLNYKLAPCGVLRFAAAYIDAHERKYDTTCEIN